MSETQNIPQKFQLNSLIHQDSYLVNNTLIKWTGDMANVYSPILTPDADGKLSKTLLGTVPNLTEKEALQALDAACAAYDKGQGEWPTMKVADRIACMETFVGKMKTKRDEVVKYLVWEICKTVADAEKRIR